MSSIRCRWTEGGDLAVLTHDLNGSANDVSFDATNGSGVVVGFDEGHRLTRESISNALYQWTGTAAGSTAYSPDRLNRYASVGGTGFTYDANGNLTSDGTWTYAYDPENWLLSATQPNKFRSYLYDPLGRRVQSNVDLGSTVFLHADDEEIGEYGAGGGLQLRYIPGPEIDRPIGWVTSGGAKRFFHADRRGSIIAVTNTSAGVTEGPYSYDAYGAPSATTGTPIKYTGRRYDAETGLYYYRARYYSPGLGRFMQTDPVGYEAGMNLYDYVQDDPVNQVDPDGTMPVDVVDVCRNNSCPSPQQVLDFYDTVADTLDTIGAYANGIEPGLGAPEVAAAGLIRLGSREASVATEGADVVINAQKQAGHVRGTAQYANRIKQGKPTSAFFGPKSADKLVRDTAKTGTPVPGRQGMMEKNYGVAVGTGPKGGSQTIVRTVTDAKGQTHGYPKGPELPQKCVKTGSNIPQGC